MLGGAGSGDVAATAMRSRDRRTKGHPTPGPEPAGPATKAPRAITDRHERQPERNRELLPCQRLSRSAREATLTSVAALPWLLGNRGTSTSLDMTATDRVIAVALVSRGLLLRVGQLEQLVQELRRRLRVSNRLCRGAHVLQSLRRGYELKNDRPQLLRTRLRLIDHHRCADIFEERRVLPLLIAPGAGEGNHYRWQTHPSAFRHRAGTRPREHQ